MPHVYLLLLVCYMQLSRVCLIFDTGFFAYFRHIQKHTTDFEHPHFRGVLSKNTTVTYQNLRLVFHLSNESYFSSIASIV